MAKYLSLLSSGKIDFLRLQRTDLGAQTQHSPAKYETSVLFTGYRVTRLGALGGGQCAR